MQLAFLFFLYFLSTSGYMLFFSTRFGWKIEVVPLSVIFGKMLVLYAASLLNILLPVTYFLYGLGFVLLVLTLVLHRRQPRALLARMGNPGFVLFWFFAVVYVITSRKLSFTVYDEFSHWGLIYKLISLADALPGKESVLIFPDYPPGTALYEYYVAKFIGFREGSAYIAFNLMVTSCIVAITACIQWAKWPRALLAFATAFIFLYMLGFRLNTIYVDHLLGLLFGAAIVCWLVSERHLSAAVPSILVMAALPIVKTTGMYFSFLILLVILLDLATRGGFLQKRALVADDPNSARPRRVNRGALTFAALALLLPVLVFLSWRIHYQSMGFEQHYTPKIGLEEVNRTFSPSASAFELQVIGLFVNALDARPLANSAISLKYFLVIFGLISGYCWFFCLRGEQEERPRFLRLNVILLVGLSLFLIMLLFIYLYSFSKNEALNLASYNRYVGSFLLGWGLILYGWLLYFPRTGDRAFHPTRYWSAAIALLLFVMMFLVTPASTYLTIQTVAEDRKQVRDLVKEYVSDMDLDAKVYVIWQNIPRGRKHVITRYEMAPRLTQYKGFSLGKPYSEDDLWTQDIDPEAWCQSLSEQNYDYVLVAQPDDQLWSTYGGCFEGFEWSAKPQLFAVEAGRLVLIK